MALPQPLPKHVVLKNAYNDKYTRFTHEDIQQHGLLQFTGETVVSPYAKFEIEPSRTASGLVHIKSAYNNKYWVRWDRTSNWIAAAAHTPDEDQSQWSCTLFRPVLFDTVDSIHTGTKNLRIRFLHVQLNHFACLFSADDSYPFANFLFAGWRDPNPSRMDVCEVIDWESFVVMPKYAAFYGDNKRFLRTRVIRGTPYLDFTATSSGHREAGHEVFTNPDGSVRIRSSDYNRFWRRNSDDWILGDSTAMTASDPDTVFWPVKVGGNVVALRSRRNNLFCKRLSSRGIESCLSAVDPTISEYARLEVEEPVLLRRIENVEFRLLDARIYNQTVRIMGENTILNNSAQTSTSTMRLTYADTRSRNWQSTVSFSYGVSGTISSGVPVIGQGTVEISWEASASYAWGETHESSQTVEVDYTVTVGPYTRMTVRLLATEASCNVPFLYTLRDTLADGRQVVTRMHDGVYTGINSFDFKWENTEQKLTAQEIKLAQAQEAEGKNIKLQVEKGDAKIIAEEIEKLAEE